MKLDLETVSKEGELFSGMFFLNAHLTKTWFITLFGCPWQFEYGWRLGTNGEFTPWPENTSSSIIKEDIMIRVEIGPVGEAAPIAASDPVVSRMGHTIEVSGKSLIGIPGKTS